MGMLEENIKAIMDELDLAFQYDRPSIILVSTDSTIGREKAKGKLKALLTEKGREIFQVELNGDSLALTRVITEGSGLEQKVIFVSKLDHGGGRDDRDSYRLLNFYREYLVDNRIKIILWLTPAEAGKLPGYSPDFWSFRHLTVHISHARQSSKRVLPAGVLLWHGQNLPDGEDDIQAGIAYRNSLLQKLPDAPEVAVSRLEIFYSLAYLYWRMGENERAHQIASDGLQHAVQFGFQDFEGRFFNSLGIIKYEDAQYSDLIDGAKRFVSEGTFDPIIASNLSLALSAAGQNHLAQVWNERCVRKEPHHSALLRARGYLQVFLGKYDEALATFKSVTEKSPREAGNYLSLAVCSHVFGFQREVEIFSAKAAEFLEAPNPVVELCLPVLSGKKEIDLEPLRKVLNAGGEMKNRILRDPDIFFLFPPSELE